MCGSTCAHVWVKCVVGGCAQVPLSCDLGQAVAQLAYLGCYDGVVDLPLRKAAAVDPDNEARLPGEAGRAGREVPTVSVLPCGSCLMCTIRPLSSVQSAVCTLRLRTHVAVLMGH